MNKVISISLLSAGIFLLIMGGHASNSVGSDLSRFFTGNRTDKTVWFLFSGMLASVVGLFGLILGPKCNP